MRVQAFRPKLAIERFDEGVVGGLARTGEIQSDAAVVGPQVEITRNELGALIDPDRLREPELPADVFKDLDNIGPAEGEPWFDRRRVARERVDDCRTRNFRPVASWS